jgi:Uma2 family endonuclease
MATVLSPTGQPVIMTGVSWQTYERLLADFRDSHAARMAFDQGTLEIMAPSFAHERPLHLIVQIVEIIAEVRNMDMVSAGSTTSIDTFSLALKAQVPCPFPLWIPLI